MNQNGSLSYLCYIVKKLEDTFGKIKEGELHRFVLNAVEKPLIEQVLEKTGGNKIKAARILGINRNTLHSKIKKFGIIVERYRDG